MVHAAVAPRDDVPHVLDFCASISSAARPVRVRSEPRLEVVPHECFDNCAQHVKAFGGSVVHGWAVWETPGLFIEAEFHAVWRTRAGMLVDVNPRPPRDSPILFLPQPELTFDGRSVDNVRRGLFDHPAVREFFARAELMAVLKERIPGWTPINPRDYAAEFKQLDELKEEEDAAREEWLQLVVIRRPDGAPCVCGSRRPFVKCHATELRGIVAANPAVRPTP
jgi:hypothetical protein